MTFTSGLLRLFLVLALGAAFARAMAADAPPRLYPAGDFNFIDQDGVAFRAERFKGKVLIVDLMFTTCGSSCPLMSKKIQALAKELKSDSRVAFLSISIDKADTPKMLKDFATRLEARAEQWVFATGDQAEIKRYATSGLKLGSPDNPDLHSTRAVLIDADGQVRGYYDLAGSHGVSGLRSALKLILEQQAGGPRARAAH